MGDRMWLVGWLLWRRGKEKQNKIKRKRGRNVKKENRIE